MRPGGFLGQGWSFPPQFDRSTFGLKLSSGEDNINQSIDVLLGTQLGSRSLSPDFGCGLKNFIFRRVDASAREEIAQSVRITLLDGEPRITVVDVDVSLSPDGTVVSILVQYIIRETNARSNHVYPFSLLEGTDLELGGS